VLVDRPDRTGRREILKVHAAKVQPAPNVDLDQIAGLTPGFTGADLANLVNEAAIVATRRNGDAVALDDFTVAIERIIAGLEKKSRVLSPEERRRVAYHEMGHALVAATLLGVAPVHSLNNHGFCSDSRACRKPNDQASVSCLSCWLHHLNVAAEDGIGAVGSDRDSRQLTGPHPGELR
jgi:hypothetical protein